MAQKLIRDIPDEIMAAIEQKASASPYKSSEAYIRNLLVQDASEPIVRTCYAYRFYNDNDNSHGIVRRFSDDLRETSCLYTDVSDEVAIACCKVEDLVRRNNIGDREAAITLLRTHFDNVFEVPVL